MREPANRRWWRTALLTILLAVIAPPGAAQVISGGLRNASDNQPLAGTFVLLLDSAGKRHAAAVTDRAGHFTMRTANPGRYRLEAAQIGYRTAHSPLLTLGKDTLSYSLSIQVEPVQLPGIEAASRERGCRRRPDGAEVAALWGEIRKALDVTAWTEATGDLTFATHVYTTTIDPRRQLLLEAEDDYTAGRGHASFPVRPPAELATQGFARMDGPDLILFGPDATSLLSDEFLDGHCFRLAADERHPGSVGLAFEPMRSRRGIADVSGTLWVDRASAALRSLDYFYTNLPRPFSPWGAGGVIDFLRLPDGLWVVQTWRIRTSLGIGVQQMGMREAGGVLLSAKQGSETQYLLTGDGVVAGTVHISPGGLPLADARVLLIGSGLYASSDEAGRYRIDAVPPGRYGIALQHGVTTGLEIPVPLDSITVTAGTTLRHDLALPDLAGVEKLLCAKMLTRDGTPGLLYGFVTDGTGRPVPGVASSADWHLYGAERTHRRTGARSDARGRYAICDLPLDTPLTIQLRSGGSVIQQSVTLPVTGLTVMRVDFNWR